MSNQDSEKLRAIQEFADEYQVIDYWDAEEGLYVFAKDELTDLFLKLWSVAERQTHQDIHNMVHNWGKR